ncbi:MAG: aminofutalosine synthase MqnE [Desulfarculaceae bacterium]|nr:aminofutalosine synthase MqnE [Desulfarculaceae bacterium]MCF8072197.1 aminofutalosine synthase MqnE [Desulfarculaceae bacterium]MCF8100118.1 aminofutalosine synthase MqnE [Desulfarculaceae bacterium]MCF8117233.1 aminofutalosine synthase MqnE [Desulfarculaceae bacterium]
MPSSANTAQASNALPSAQLLPPLELDRSLITDPALLPIAAKLAAGQRLSYDDGLTLMTSRDLLGLGALAHPARLAKNGQRAYYVINRHVNYSNVCVNKCAFCAFWRDEDQEGAYLLGPEEAAALAAEHPGLDLAELHVVGSCHPGLGLDYYCDLLRAVGRARPEAGLKAFTAVEIDHFARQEGITTGQVLDRLIEAGLAAMPGGGAEIFSSRVRARLCAKKAPAAQWLSISGQAHERGIPTNATMLYGHIETPSERVEHLLALRDQQDISGGFSAFIPLAFHPDNTELNQMNRTSGLDDLRVIAASRLLLDNFPHIKAYWVMLGPKLAQVALNFGADDLDGTIVEERITHAAAAPTAKGLTEDELRHMIQAAGFTPVRRDCFYNSLEAN